MVIGFAAGAVIATIDTLFISFGLWQGFEHPPIPLSILASATAGIGEEILFRGFVMVLWAFLLNALLKRWKAKAAALWIANGIAALAFGAALAIQPSYGLYASSLIFRCSPEGGLCKVCDDP